MLGGAIRVSTPFMFVALGECLTEKSGRVNLGLEGTLVLGAMVAYAISYHTGSPWLGVLAAGVAGSLLGAMHGVDLQAAARQRRRRRHRDDAVRHRRRVLFRQALHPADGAAPGLDPARRLQRQSRTCAARCDVNPLFFVGIAVALLMAWAFANTRWGLIVRTVGDSAAAARAMGISVDLRALALDDRRRLSRRRRRRVPVALLSRHRGTRACRRARA